MNKESDLSKKGTTWTMKRLMMMTKKAMRGICQGFSMHRLCLVPKVSGGQAPVAKHVQVAALNAHQIGHVVRATAKISFTTDAAANATAIQAPTTQTLKIATHAAQAGTGTVTHASRAASTTA